MKIEVNEVILGKLAIDLNIDPELLAKKLVNHIINNFPRYAVNQIINRYCTLNDVLKVMVENSELGYTLDHLVKKTMGEYSYGIEYCDCNTEDGTIFIEIALLNNNLESNISEVSLQYGNESEINVKSSIDSIELDVSIGELEEQIYEKIYGYSLIDEAKDYSVELHDELDPDEILIFLTIESDEMLKLPKLSDVDDVMTHIKEIILSHKLT